MLLIKEEDSQSEAAEEGQKKGGTQNEPDEIGRRVRPRNRGDHRQPQRGLKEESSPTTGAQMALFGNFL